ncbi:DnaD domain-containing protein [Sporosarcina highlanderae]|uniref:DnaD domain-containing protein n=1 Tax=Sporosarcina highlanderae TaxID=3035916 RepID=A0ABT8JU80_9BACL|nr:DnaD domain-containing protein [Sporosarcina highlanderae]MDN4608708.1 DnaD domain-containing protein [Sporosarcina highlanderae]
MQDEERLRIWIEQGNLTISQLFFQHYKALDIKDLDAMLIMHMLAFQSNGSQFPTPLELAGRMHLNVNQVSEILQRLMQRGLLEIKQDQDSNGVLYEQISMHSLWDRLVTIALAEKNNVEEEISQNDEGEIFTLFEQEFGRLLSPMECETITMWLDEDGHTTQIIRAALKEAVLAQKLSLRYIDRILFEWKKKNIKTLSDVEKQSKTFRTAIVRPAQKQDSSVKKVPFYNWLEERE